MGPKHTVQSSLHWRSHGKYFLPHNAPSTFWFFWGNRPFCHPAEWQVCNALAKKTFWFVELEVRCAGMHTAECSFSRQKGKKNWKRCPSFQHTWPNYSMWKSLNLRMPGRCMFSLSSTEIREETFSWSTLMIKSMTSDNSALMSLVVSDSPQNIHCVQSARRASSNSI